MSNKSIRRIQREVTLYHKSDLNTHGIYIHFNESDIYNAKALIIGPKESPYQNGFYLFDITYPQNYPQTPPQVVLCTINKYARFNPNLYTNGKVCLSILGTWSGPGWTPCLSTNEVLLSIQSLLTNNPVQNEPGYEKLCLKTSTQAQTYVKIIEYHNYRIAILQVINNIPKGFEPFKPIMEQKFIELYDENMSVICEKPSIQLNLRMYNLNVFTDYQYIIEEFKKLYKTLKDTLSPIITPKNSNSNSNTEFNTDGNSTHSNVSVDIKVSGENTISTKSKKRVPSNPASNYDENTIMISDNDGRKYQVAIINSKNSNTYKRWVLVK